jgi:Zn-dependent membrane protease YugP
MFFDTNYLILVMIPTLVLSGAAQLFVQSAFNKWSSIRNQRGMIGEQVAIAIMRSAGLTGVRLEGVPGVMTDHFDPTTNVVRMSEPVAAKPSVASMAIVAHELGHAQQYQERSVLIGMRSFLLPAVRISPNISYALILLGLVTNALGLVQLGILFFGVVVMFMVLTLPVEIDASLRGMRLLRQSGVMTTAQDESGARAVLTAAAMTCLAAAITAILQLVYYIMLVNSRRN